MTQLSVQCGGCNAVLDETSQQIEREPCPYCGSSLRHFKLSFSDEIQIKEQVGLKVKDPTQTGKKKIRIEQLVGDDLHKRSGKWFKKERVIDRENDRYFEEVVDPDTGEVLHHCDEPLSQHHDHGSARSPKEDT